MHSTSSSEICPSAVTSLWPMPSFLQACSQSLSPSFSRQLMLVQTCTWYLPSGLRCSIE